MKIYCSQSLYMSCSLIIISLFGLLLSCSEPVVINYFSASPTTVTKGQAVTLQWSVSGAARVNLNNDIGDVAHSGKAIVIPVATTTYVLTAINSSQTLTREISITVNTLPETSSTQADTTTGQTSASKQEDNFIGTPAVLRYDNLDTVTDNYLSNQVAVWHTYAKQPGSVAVASAYYAGDTRRGSVGPAVVPVRSPLIILPLKDGMVCIVKNYANLSYQYYKITSTGYDNILDDAERLNQLGWGLMTTFSPERFPFKIQKINIAAVTNHTGPPEEYEKYHFVVRILDGN
ncbi:MAG: hypothetical protein NT082_07365, partial [Chloroflexi bacterium]|nr:hypothetical protein [Chloroflexota bacterium]